MKLEENQEKSDFHTKSVTSITFGGPIWYACTEQQCAASLPDPVEVPSVHTRSQAVLAVDWLNDVRTLQVPINM